MKILLLSKYSSLGASSRLRSYQYLPSLQKAGWKVDVSPLFGDGYLNALYHNQPKILQAVSGYLKRILAMTRVKRCDLLWIEKELLPFFPPFLEDWLAALRVPYLVDYDDAIFHRYDQHPSGTVRKLLGHKIERVMRQAALVTAGNQYLAGYAESAGAPEVLLLPTVVDLERYTIKQHRDAKPITVGWIGSPATSRYLLKIERVIREMAIPGDIRFVAIGAKQDDLSDLPFEVWEWSEQEEVQLLNRLDIGIMPLENTPWEQGKCGYKLIQYMACGLPVIASPVGVNNDLVVDGVNGFLAETDSEWESAIHRLANTPELRKKMGAEGREIIVDSYNLSVQAPRLLAALKSVVTV